MACNLFCTHTMYGIGWSAIEFFKGWSFGTRGGRLPYALERICLCLRIRHYQQIIHISNCLVDTITLHDQESRSWN
jgi:hypothetical protein